MQEILGLVRRCVEDYDMIQAGDTVAVGVSGGKDSLLTLTALARLSRFYPKPFRVVAMTVEAGTPGMSFDGVADYCRALGVEYIRVSVPIYEVVFLERREKNPCSLCAKLRRGAAWRTASRGSSPYARGTRPRRWGRSRGCTLRRARGSNPPRRRSSCPACPPQRSWRRPGTAWDKSGSAARAR